jgi:hypothetical protein
MLLPQYLIVTPSVEQDGVRSTFEEVFEFQRVYVEQSHFQADKDVLGEESKYMYSRAEWLDVLTVP